MGPFYLKNKGIFDRMGVDKLAIPFNFPRAGKKIMRKAAFVKISGDLTKRKMVVEWIKNLAKDHYIVICIGGGTQINKEFERRGWGKKFGPLGRETETFKQRQVARDILERNQADIQDFLAKHKILATVIIPVLDIGSVLCHVNGDIFIQAAYLGFDQLFILTHLDRVEKKKQQFRDYPKIQVISFSEK